MSENQSGISLTMEAVMLVSAIAFLTTKRTKCGVVCVCDVIFSSY